MSAEIIEFKAWPKIGRLRRGVTLTEKIDGTNACVIVTEDGRVAAQSRTRLITPEADNFGFARWVEEHKEELAALGPGYHYGEWWGLGIQRTYGLTEKRFSLFSTQRWRDGRAERPACCGVVPLLYEGEFTDRSVTNALEWLSIAGSAAAPGFMKPEGVVVFLHGTSTMAKVLLENDDVPKGLAEAA